MRRLLAGAIVFGAVLCIVSVLYLMGPKTNCDYDPPEGTGFSQPLCLTPEHTNPWERISGAITGD